LTKAILQSKVSFQGKKELLKNIEYHTTPRLKIGYLSVEEAYFKTF